MKEICSSNYHSETDIRKLDDIADDIRRTLPPPAETFRLVVTIPANNEEKNIALSLKSLVSQHSMAHIGIDHKLYEVLVICHNCTDGTSKICSKFQADYPTFNLRVIELNRPEVNNVGAVRRVLMRIAAARLPFDDGYIATTDADTMVNRYWIANLLGFIGSGYGMVCGRIDIDYGTISGNARLTLEHKQKYFGLRTQLEHFISPEITDPWPRHAHNSGPNLAVRRDVYLEIGGMPPKGFLEDIALYDAVCAAGHNIRHCPYTLVTTSCRLTPRAPWGFGSELRDWSESECIFFEVEGVRRLIAKFKLFETIRCHYRNPSKKTIGSITAATGLGEDQIADYLGLFQSARAMINKIDRELDELESWQLRYPLKIVSIAVRELEDYMANI